MACGTCGGNKTTPRKNNNNQKSNLKTYDEQGREVYELNGKKYIIDDNAKRHTN